MAIRLFKRRVKQVAVQRAYCETFNLDDMHDRLVVQDLCSAHGVFDGGFDLDPLQHAFNAGERNVVLRILTIIGLSSDDTLKLIEEEAEPTDEED